MRVQIIKDLSEALEKMPIDRIKLFLNAIDEVKNLNKTEILGLDKTVMLTKEGSVEFYAYEMADPYYVLFTFRPKKTMLLLDVIEFTGESLKFLAFSKVLEDQDDV